MRTYSLKRPPLDPCPVETTLSYIGGKWTARIFHLILIQPIHFNGLLRALPGITKEVLATRLNQLIAAGFIEKAPGERSRSVYYLTERGRGIVAVLEVMAEWGEIEIKEQGKKWIKPAGSR